MSVWGLPKNDHRHPPANPRKTHFCKNRCCPVWNIHHNWRKVPATLHSNTSSVFAPDDTCPPLPLLLKETINTKKSRSYGLFRTGVGGSTPFHRFCGCFSNYKGDLDTTNLTTKLPISPQNKKINDKTPPYVFVDAGGLQKVRLTFPTMKVKISDSF